MSAQKNRVLCLLSILICMAGCKSSKTIITVNPDGSGTVVLDINFDRATDEQRDKFRQQLGSEGFSCDFQEEKFRPWFPEPHFTIKNYKFDTEKLTVHAEISFTDINRLLVKKNAQLLEMSGLDFSSVKDALNFSIKRKAASGMGSMVRKGEKASPTIREIVIVNGHTKESVRFYHETDPNSVAGQWDDSLEIKGHTIERKQIKRNFAGYPVVKLDARIHEASWSLHKTSRSDMSDLGITVEAAIPQDKGITYVGWSEPVLLSGGYVPEQEMELTNTCQNLSRNFINNFSPKPKSNHFMLPLEFNFPTLPATSISDSVVRVKALRARGSKLYKLGKIKPETKYEAGGMSFTSDKAKNNYLTFSIKGDVGVVKSFVFQTERGSRFMLDESSSSVSRDGGSLGVRTVFPLDKGDVYVELYETIDYAWLDVLVPAIDFEKKAIVTTKPGKSVDLRKAIAAELDEPLEGLDKEVFANKVNMAGFFKSLPDEKLLAAVAQVVDSEYMPDTGNEQRLWYQNIVRKEISSRKKYMENNGKQIAEKLFSLQMYLPAAKKDLVKYLPTNLKLGSYLRDKVLAAIEQGDYLSANIGYFSGGITASERRILTKALYLAPGIYSWAILDILLDPKYVELNFAEEVLKNENLDQVMRSKALGAVFKHGDLTDLSFVKDYIEDPKMRQSVVQAIWDFVRYVNTANDIVVMKEKIKPLLPLLQDLADYPNSQQRDAKRILDKLK
ncbi:MAG: hypothetical protein K9M75_12665 [Phycisphaerae bacterium]|nr:hypothetical protein [Phycisphaerae bacterium]